MNRFDELKNALFLYKSRIDGIVSKYLNEKARISETYSEKTAQEMHEDNLLREKQKFADEQNGIINRVNGILGDVQDELRRWIATPIKDNQLSLVSTLISLGIKVSSAEIEALQTSLGGNYFANKLVERLAAESGVRGYKSPFRLETYTKLLQDVKTESEIFISGYCGGRNAMCIELLPEETRPSKYITYAAASCRPLAPDSAVSAAALIWDGDSLPMTKTKISATDADALHDIFDGMTDEQRAQKTEKLLHDFPTMREVLNLSPYARFVPQEETQTETA